MEPVSVIWPGGEHAMRLALAQLEALQNKTDAGPEHLLNKLRMGQWTAAELFEVLRWGLIGGGMDHVKAEKLVKRVIDRHPIGAFKLAAMQVLAHAMYGPSDDQVGEGGPVEEPTPGQQKTESGNLAPSTE